MPEPKQKWNLSNIPPEGHTDLGKFIYALFEDSRREKERLGLMDRWIDNYRIARGKHWGERYNKKMRQKHLAFNLTFANLQRINANVISGDPQIEVQLSDAIEDPAAISADTMMNRKIKNWWSETGQQRQLEKSAYQMWMYGPTIEKAVVIDTGKRVFIDNEEFPVYDLKIVVCDPFTIFPEPGYFDDISTDAAFIAQAQPFRIDALEKEHGVEIKPSDTHSILGMDRERYKPQPIGMSSIDPVKYDAGGKNVALHEEESLYDKKRSLVVEMWIRDSSLATRVVSETVQVEVVNPDTGETEIASVERKFEVLKYPDGIRKITVANGGDVVLDDRPNPNINYNLDPVAVEDTYAFGRFPFYIETAYNDNLDIWGFSDIEQTGPLNIKIDEIMASLIHYIKLSLKPPLVNPKDTGIKNEKITNRAGLILNPVSAAAGAGLRFLQVPPLSPDHYRMLALVEKYFDRINSIQDVDRGEAPAGIESGKAIQSLQARNAVLMQRKIKAVERIVDKRGRWAVSFNQNFGYVVESLRIGDDTVLFQPIRFVNRKFNVMVQSGSMVFTPEVQRKAEAIQLYDRQIIDRPALLEEAWRYPNAKAIIERIGEGQLDAALAVLQQAGMPQESVMQLKQQLMEPQGGPGGRAATTAQGAAQQSVAAEQQGGGAGATI